MNKSYMSIIEFEEALSKYTNAPYVVATDGCTHAIELAMRYYNIKKCSFTPFTYLSVVQTMQQLDIDYELIAEHWKGEYQFHGTNIWDSARMLTPDMYRKNQVQCLSFGIGKPMSLGKVGAILLDDKEAYIELSKMRSDGRDLKKYPIPGPIEWFAQKIFKNGYHYCPSIEDCEKGAKLIQNYKGSVQDFKYYDCRQTLVIYP